MLKFPELYQIRFTICDSGNVSHTRVIFLTWHHQEKERTLKMIDTKQGVEQKTHLLHRTVSERAVSHAGTT